MEEHVPRHHHTVANVREDGEEWCARLQFVIPLVIMEVSVSDRMSVLANQDLKVFNIRWNIPNPLFHLIVGPNCGSVVCSPPCQNEGKCIQPYKCSCPLGFGGRFCQNCKSSWNDDLEEVIHFTGLGSKCGRDEDLCLLNCQNGGECSQNLKRCICTDEFYGDFCEQR